MENMVVKKKILILGGTGFIGRNLSEYFGGFHEQLSVDSPTRKELDLSDEIQVKNFLTETFYDVILHAAVFNPRVAEYGDKNKELETNLRMFYNFERYQNLFGRMYYFGSGAEYDKTNEISLVTEDYFGNGIPKTDYGLYKYIINKSIKNSYNIFNFRVFGLFGKYENWKNTFISGACCKALKNIPITIRQNVFFDYLYIDDFCKIIYWFINNSPKRKSYNLTSGRKIDLVTIAGIIKATAQKDLPVYICYSGNAKEYTSDNSRLVNELQNYSFTDIEEAIGQLYKWYRNHEGVIDKYYLLYQYN